VVRPTLLTFALLIVTGVATDAQTPPAGKTPQSTRQEAQTLNLQAYAELLRSDLRTQKIAIITEVMGSTEAEDKAFWPIYRQYDLEMSKLGDERVAMIEEYANNYAKMTDAISEKLAARALDLETRRQALKGKCYESVKKALSPTTALRFLQVEHQLQLLVDLQIAASLPIAPTEDAGGK
jgi:hypothetical protein